MKEATGEANMTIITVVLIAAVVAIATPLITNAIKQNRVKVNCLNAGCYWYQGSCYMKENGQGGECTPNLNNSDQSVL